MRDSESELIYNLFLYTGATTAGGEKPYVRKVALKLCNNVVWMPLETLLSPGFTTVDLCLDLKEKGILTTATIRSNFLGSCTLKTEAEMRTAGRGSSTCQTDQNKSLVILHWYDNKCVTLVSTHLSVD